MIRTYAFGLNVRSLAIVVSFAILSCLNVYAKEYFVDGNQPDDSGDGTTRGTAFKTIQAAVSQHDATIVTVFPGIYERGEATTVDVNGIATCVYIDKPLTLRSDGGRHSTFIVGQHSQGKKGSGSDSVRCISTSVDGIVIEGFTLYNGSAPAEKTSEEASNDTLYGGGIFVSAAATEVYVNDCIISNCVANRGGGVFCGYYERCLFTCNNATDRASVGYKGYFRNCAVYKNAGTCFAYSQGLLNCAFIENTGTVLHTHDSGSMPVYNCVFSGNAGVGNDKYYYCNCVFDVAEDKIPEDKAEDCVFGATERQFENHSQNDWRVFRDAAAKTAGDAKWLSKVIFLDKPFIDYLGDGITKTEGAICAGPCQTVVYSTPWYVDAVNGSDEKNDGRTPDAPMKTLEAILSVPELLEGDVVHAAPGDYDKGGVLHSDTVTVFSRAYVPKGVTLLADAGPETTFIVGGSASSDVADEYGLGSNAVRCVTLARGAKVSGFTIAGGRTHKEKSDGNDSGSAVLGMGLSSIAENCVITGNVGYSGSICNCHVANSRIFDNHATFRRAVGYNMQLSGCVMDRNTGDIPIEYFSGIFNCTIGSNHSAMNSRSTAVSVDNPTVVNTLVLMTKGVAINVAARNSAFVEGSGVQLENLAGCVVANAGALQVDADFIPVIGSNVAVDAASLELYDAEVCGKKDVYGRQRVANGAMDIGAVEAPWLNRYAQDLSRSGIVVTDASPMVVETESANVSILDGRLDLEWSNPFGREFKHVIPVKITGTGMLTVMLDGDVLGTVSKTDGDVELSFRSSLAVNRMSFVYVPGENDNGKAVIGGLKRIIGLVVVVR